MVLVRPKVKRMSGLRKKPIQIATKSELVWESSLLNSNGKIIDIRKYKDEAIKLCIANNWLNNQRFLYNGPHTLLRREKTKKQYRASHNSKNFRSKSHFNIKRTMTHNSVRECREFVRGRDKMLEITCFEFNKPRIISCSWKDQTKDRKQWMHNAKRTTFN